MSREEDGPAFLILTTIGLAQHVHAGKVEENAFTPASAALQTWSTVQLLPHFPADLHHHPPFAPIMQLLRPTDPPT